MTGGGDEAAANRAALPEGARDVLPVESAELAAIEAALRSALASYGYREVRTPLLEFAEAMDRAQDGGIGRAYRLFDDHGEVLVVRPDLTIPVARLVAGRLHDHPGPLRVTYTGERLRPAPVGKAQRVEERQTGMELVGLPGSAADAEVVGFLVSALRALGVADLRVGIGDVRLVRAVLDGLGVRAEDRAALQESVRTRNLVAWRRIAEGLPLDAGARALVGGLPMRRGGVKVLDELASAVPGAAGACRDLADTIALLERHGAADCVMIDLGVLRDWGYYSGIVFEAYAPGIGKPVAVGGRYDDLIGRFGAPRPAVGAAMLLDRLHEALAARTAADDGARGVVLAGGIGAELAAATAARAAGWTVVGVQDDAAAAAALAAAEGWRFVACRDGDAFRVEDRSDGRSVRTVDLLEGLRSLES